MTEFLESVRRIVDGRSVVDPVLVQELIAARRRHDPLGPLTEREWEVLANMAQGYSNVGIANRLCAGEGADGLVPARGVDHVDAGCADDEVAVDSVLIGW